MAIKNIIFDLGGVILNIDLTRTQDAFTSLGVKDIKEIFRMGHVESFFKAYEVGALTDEQFIAEIQSRIGNKVSTQQIVDAWNILLLDFPPERIQLLRDLKKKGYRLFLLSNTSGLHQVQFHKVFKEEFGSAFDDLFEKAYYSHLIKLHKPNAAAYQLILDENNLVAEETIFVDDSKANVEGAETLGIKGVYIAPGTSILDIDFENATIAAG